MSIHYESYISRLRSIWERSDSERERIINLMNSFFNLKGSNSLVNLPPCFFSGNIKSQGRIFLLTANPKFTPISTPNEIKQHAMTKSTRWDFTRWTDYCLNRFLKYKKEQEVHPIYKEAIKVILDCSSIKELRRKFGDSRIVLQNNLINLDWCPYYSSSFSSSKFPLQILHKQKAEYENVSSEISLWNELLLDAISLNQPKYVLVFGKNYDFWLRSIADIDDEPLVRSHSTATINKGYFRNKYHTPLIYTNTSLSGSNKEYMPFIRKRLPTVLNAQFKP
ncbi:hypothetical protein CEE45_13905 [Candidatus Heimdallarchaeota archaeon B3_Heim]|nr:MAG: hypothetical protein CEE45_13905 [Candidatus Heimdallarchaeota archaeon B3_Heim]